MIARLTPDEERFCVGLEASRRTFRRGSMVQRETTPASDLHIIRSGWAYSSVLLHTGARQILEFHYPGECVGCEALAFREAPASICAVTDLEVSSFDRGVVQTIFSEQPRLAALMLMLAQIKAVRAADRLAAVGRLSARARVAALIADLHVNTQTFSPAPEARFLLPLTQEEIGDATGLTAVHVNRMMRSLAEDGMIARQAGYLTVLDLPRLKALASYVDRTEQIDAGWLPPAG